MPMIGPTVFFHTSVQPGFALSQVSAHAGSEISATARLTNSTSFAVGRTVVMLYFLPVVHGSWPALQRMPSDHSSSEYFQMSSVNPSTAALSFACWSDGSLFHAFRWIA